VNRFFEILIQGQVFTFTFNASYFKRRTVQNAVVIPVALKNRRFWSRAEQVSYH